MGLGSKKRDYVSSDDKVTCHVQKHIERMMELEADGMTKTGASARAYAEIMRGDYEAEIKKMIKERVASRNGRK